MTFELQYYVNVKENFKLKKFDNLSIQFEKQSIISIQSFLSAMWAENNQVITLKLWMFHLC